MFTCVPLDGASGSVRGRQDDELPAAKRLRRSVHYGAVVVRYFAVVCDGAKLPSDGVAPLGLGALQATESHSLDDYEARQCAGVSQVPCADRLSRLSHEDSAFVSAVGSENAAILAQSMGAEEPVPDGGGGSASGTPLHPGYTTAAEGDKRDGAGGGFSEVDPAEDELRQKRAAEARRQTAERKAERRRCPGCKRCACIC